MLKYVETEVTFSEVPNETTLCINISNCPNHCESCHSPWLAEDIGTQLNLENLNTLICNNNGITCVAFMGGDSDPKTINQLAKEVHNLNLKTCWYSGNKELNSDIELHNFDYIKLGPYIEKYGPLTSKETNQRFYQVIFGKKLKDITSLFHKE